MSASTTDHRTTSTTSTAHGPLGDRTDQDVLEAGAAMGAHHDEIVRAIVLE